LGSGDDDQIPAQTPSLKSALDSMLSSIFTPLSEAPAVDAAREDFLKKYMKETFLSAGKLDKKRVLEAAGKVGLRPPPGCGPKARGSGNQLAAFAENVAYEIFDQAKFAASTPGGGSASSLSSTADSPKRTLGAWLHRWRQHEETCETPACGSQGL
jgi:hypothetical protein